MQRGWRGGTTVHAHSTKAQTCDELRAGSNVSCLIHFIPHFLYWLVPQPYFFFPKLSLICFKEKKGIYSSLNLTLICLELAMPHESSIAAHEHSHPYPAAAHPPPSPWVPADPPIESSNQPEPSPASAESGYDSENEDWLDILEESTHNGHKFPCNVLFDISSDGLTRIFCSSWLHWRQCLKPQTSCREAPVCGLSWAHPGSYPWCWPPSHSLVPHTLSPPSPLGLPGPSWTTWPAYTWHSQPRFVPFYILFMHNANI